MKKQNKEYYVVTSGRDITIPALFSSWAKAHLRVVGYSGSQHRAFHTFEQATEYLKERGYTRYAIDVASNCEDTTPSRGSPAYYAVACGREKGIYTDYKFPGAQTEVDRCTFNCHKHFKTEEQAKTFMREFEETYDYLVPKEIKENSTEQPRPAQLRDALARRDLIKREQTSLWHEHIAFDGIAVNLGKLNIDNEFDKEVKTRDI